MELTTLIARLGDWRRFDALQSGALAQSLEALILAGDLLPGDLVPPERRLASALGVSRTTVVMAYDRLRESGWVQSRRGSGTRVQKGPPGHVAASRQRLGLGNPLAGQEALEFPRDDAPPIDLSLSAALPDASWLTLSGAARATLLTEYAYQPRGLPALRERIARRYTAQGLPTLPDEVLVTNGVQQGIALIAARYGGTGRRVLVEDPTYFGALDAFRSSGMTLCPCPIEGDHPSRRFIATLESGDVDMAYLCPTVHNPTGHTWSEAARKQLARSVAATGVLTVVDDALADLRLGAALPTPAHFARDAPFVVLGGLSKTLWGGLRVGWLRADRSIVNALAEDRLVCDLGSSLVSAALACDLLDRYDELLDARRKTLLAQRDLCIATLRQRLPDWRFLPPDGGMFLWIRLPETGHPDCADAFVKAARRNGVVLTPGSALRADRRDEAHLRIAYVSPPAVLVEGIARLAETWRAFANVT